MRAITWCGALFLLVAAPLVAGDWHYRQNGTCSDCHTQHNSQNGSPMRTDNNPNPAPLLLLRGTTDELCLSCHGGTNPNAPSVLATSGYATPGGSFPTNYSDLSTNVSHHLNTAPVVPPGGTLPMTLTCTTCHDPHGNDGYRNLRPDPTKTGLPPVSIVAVQQNAANGSNPGLVYTAANIVYKSGVSEWCGQCHGASGPAAHHPVGRTMFGALSASYATWAGVALPRVPVHSPTDSVIPSADDQVICLSCHKAHGTENWKALTYADGTTLDSTCQECHNQ